MAGTWNNFVLPQYSTTWNYIPDIVLIQSATTALAMLTLLTDYARTPDYVGIPDYAGTPDYADPTEWGQVDLQSIQHHDYFGHL